MLSRTARWLLCPHGQTHGDYPGFRELGVHRSIRPAFLLYVFRAMRPELDRLVMGSTHQTIYMPDVGGLVCPIPPLDEQDGIVQCIRSETAKIDRLTVKVRAAIERLREYRAALVSAAVTGKIDVREAA